MQPRSHQETPSSVYLQPWSDPRLYSMIFIKLARGGGTVIYLSFFHVFSRITKHLSSSKCFASCWLLRPWEAGRTCLGRSQCLVSVPHLDWALAGVVSHGGLQSSPSSSTVGWGFRRVELLTQQCTARKWECLSLSLGPWLLTPVEFCYCSKCPHSLWWMVISIHRW